MKRAVILLTVLLVATSLAGCSTFNKLMNRPDPVVTQSTMTKGLSLSKGVTYNVIAWVKNNGADGKIKVTAELISNTGQVRDTASKTIYLKKGQSTKVTLTLDGELGVTYTYKIHAEPV